MPTTEKDPLEERLKSLERLPRAAREEIDEIADEWKGVHYKWWVGTLAAYLVGYAIYGLSETTYDRWVLPLFQSR